MGRLLRDCLMYFGIEFALIYFAIEERKEE